jgi:hypothetical protein
MIEELTGFDFPVAVTSSHEDVARGIAERTQRARTWMSDLFGLEPAIRVEVLGAEDWKDRAEIQVYGLPHINDAGTMYLAATDSPLFDDAVALTLEHLSQDGRQNFEAVYGEPPSMRGFRDLLCLHELAHTYHSQAGFLIEPLWLMEFFCNITLQGFLAETEPATLPQLETWPIAADQIPPSRQGVAGLDLMTPEDPPAYVWYELRLQVMAIDTWQAGGRRALRELYDVCLKAGKEDRPVALDELPREVAAVVADWPNAGR